MSNYKTVSFRSSQHPLKCSQATTRQATTIHTFSGIDFFAWKSQARNFKTLLNHFSKQRSTNLRFQRVVSQNRYHQTKEFSVTMDFFLGWLCVAERERENKTKWTKTVKHLKSIIIQTSYFTIEWDLIAFNLSYFAFQTLWHFKTLHSNAL